MSGLVTFFFLFFTTVAGASAPAPDKAWLQLLHYHNDQSDILPGKFFLSSKGHRNPKAELQATIAGMNSSEVYCKFPARRRWLENKGIKFPERTCPAYDDWTRGGSIKSISLIFASGFLGNPASYFGHPLLKFNFKDDRSPLELLDTAINYGAFTPPNVGGVEYAVKGIFGGYEAGFTASDFFFHRSNYSELELRDLWEHELDLTSEQVNLIVAHLWELLEARIPYYFFQDNCAYRMSELLEIGTGKTFRDGFLPVAIPVTVFHKLKDHGLIRKVALLPSRQTRLREKVSSLTNQEKKHLHRIAEDSKHASSEDFRSLSETARSRVLDTGLDYLSYRKILDGDDSTTDSRRSLLRERLKLPPVPSSFESISQRPPAEAQKPVLLHAGFFQSEEYGPGSRLRIRPVYYDLIAPDAARPPHSSLAITDLDLNFSDKKIWIQSFQLLSIETLNISKTGLSGDGGFAWKIKAGAEQLNLSCNDCLVTKFEGGGGKAWEFNRTIVVYGFVEPRLQTSEESSGNIAVTPNLGTLLTFSEDLRINAFAGRRYFIDGNRAIEDIYSVDARIGSNRNWDFRVSFQEHEGRRYSVGIDTFW